MASKLSTEQATAIVDENEPLKRCDGDDFCYWHCSGKLDGYSYRSLRVEDETLSKDSTLAQSRTYFINYFKTLDYLGIKPIQTDEVPE